MTNDPLSIINLPQKLGPALLHLARTTMNFIRTKSIKIWFLSLSLCGAVFSGSFTFSRINPGLPDVSGRLVFLVLATVTLLYLVREDKELSPEFKGFLRAPIFRVMSAGCLFYLWLLMNVISFGRDELASKMVVELLWIVSVLALSGYACWLLGEDILKRLAKITVFACVLWSLVFWLQEKNVELAQNIPFATAFTFYRCQLLAIFCVLYLIKSEQIATLSGYLIVIFLLTSTFFSLSKAAFLCVIVAFIYFIFINFRKKLFQTVMGCSISLVIATLLLLLSDSGDSFAQRVMVSTGEGYKVELTETQREKYFSSQNESERAVALVINFLTRADEVILLPEVDPELVEVITRFKERNLILPDTTFRLKWTNLVRQIHGKDN